MVSASQDKQCSLCCISHGVIYGSIAAFCVNLAAVLCSLKRERRRNYTMPQVARQLMWMSIPGTLCSASLHLFLVGTMWSERRNTWGGAWFKALAMNTSLWVCAIAIGTISWRSLLPKFVAGRRIHHRFPVPFDPLEFRQMRPNTTNEFFFSSMGFTYWGLGLVTGEIGFATTVSLMLYQDRPHYFMTPTGSYGVACMPLWRRHAVARGAGMPLPPT